MRIDVNKALVVLAGVTAASCSGYSKVLKSNDSNLRYQTAIEYTDKGKYNKALTLFQDVAHVYAQSARADTLAYYTGLCYYKSGDFVSSAELFDGFRRRFGRSPFLEDAEYMYAKGFYFSSPKPEYDQTATHQALQAITEYLDRYPNSVKKDQLIENMIELRQKLYDKAFMNAKVYYDIGYYNSAVTALQNAIDMYPESGHREELAYLIVSAHCLYARNSVASLQRQRYLDTQNAYYNFVDQYPDSKYKKEVDKMLEEAKKHLAKYGDPQNGSNSDNTNQSDNSETKDGNQEK